MPMARIAVMGNPGKEFVFKDELREIDIKYKEAVARGEKESAEGARTDAMTILDDRYERQLMNPKEALSLGSVSRIVMPGESRRVLSRNLDFLMRNYTPSAMTGVQREHE